MATAGQGAVAEFSENGELEKTIVGGPLASPCGVAIAPSSFGKLGGDLLVGNFSFVPGVADMINAFNPVTDALVGSIEVNPGAGNTAGGLWSMVFGGSGSDGNPNTLFFTDGINGETGGLFGSLTAAPGSVSAVPEPSTWAMMLAGFGGLALCGRAAAARRPRRSAERSVWKEPREKSGGSFFSADLVKPATGARAYVGAGERARLVSTNAQVRCLRLCPSARMRHAIKRHSYDELSSGENFQSINPRG